MNDRHVTRVSHVILGRKVKFVAICTCREEFPWRENKRMAEADALFHDLDIIAEQPDTGEVEE
jgi:hypothetical protein